MHYTTVRQRYSVGRPWSIIASLAALLVAVPAESSGAGPVGPSRNGAPVPTPLVAVAVAPTVKPPTVHVRQISLSTNDLIYDPVSRLLFASVPSRAGPTGNSVVPIDPATGAVGPSIWVGSEPNRLAVSDDGQYLYVSLDGAAAVRRVHIPTRTPGLQFWLGTDAQLGPYFAENIKVLPGSPGSVAVARRNGCCSSMHEGVAIYDEGVQRPQTTPRHSGARVLAFSDSASVLYGSDPGWGWAEFYRIAVSESGAAVAGSVRGLLGGGSDLVFAHGLLYDMSGVVVDPAGPGRVGTFSFGDRAYPSAVRPDGPGGHVYFVTGDWDGPRSLRAFDPTTFLELWSLPIPSPGQYSAPVNLVRWGANGLAYRTSSGYVFLLEVGAAAPAAARAATPSPTLVQAPKAIIR